MLHVSAQFPELLIARSFVTISFCHCCVQRPQSQRPSRLHGLRAPQRNAHTPPELRHLQHGRRVPIVTSIGKLAAWQFGDRWRPAIVMSHGWGGVGAARNFVNSCSRCMMRVFRSGCSIMSATA